MTWGVYLLESLDEIGAPYVAEGKYVFVWQKNGDEWEVILDISNQTEPYFEALEELEALDQPAEAASE